MSSSLYSHKNGAQLLTMIDAIPESNTSLVDSIFCKKHIEAFRASLRARNFADAGTFARNMQRTMMETGLLDLICKMEDYIDDLDVMAACSSMEEDAAANKKCTIIETSSGEKEAFKPMQAPTSVSSVSSSFSLRV